MRELTKSNAIAFVRERADIFDAQPNPFSKSAWLQHFIDQIIEPNGCVLALEHSDPAGYDYSVALLYRDGLRIRPLTNYYASLYSPIVSTADPRPDIYAGIVQQLRGSAIQFAPLDAFDPSTAALQGALNDNGWFTYKYFAAANWHLPNPGTWDEYLAGRDSQLRSTIKRKGKAFPGELRVVTADVEAAMDAYDALAAKQQWKQPESHPPFVRGWARICAENGWLRLGVAEVNGGPVAVHFWFVIDGVASIFKLAYDESQSKLSAGTLVTAMLMKHVLDVDKVREVDYLTGDDPYKAAWMSHRRERFGLAAFNKRTVVGATRAAVEYAKLLVKQ